MAKKPKHQRLLPPKRQQQERSFWDFHDGRFQEWERPFCFLGSKRQEHLTAKIAKKSRKRR
jgi:hypothetical protein